MAEERHVDEAGRPYAVRDGETVWLAEPVYQDEAGRHYTVRDGQSVWLTDEQVAHQAALADSPAVPAAAPVATPVVPAAAPQAAAASPAALLRRKHASWANSGAGWLAAIGGLSFINAVMIMGETNLRLVIGLVSTDLLMYLFGERGFAGQMGSLLAALVAGAGFVGLWFLTRKGKPWALLVGTIIYALDTLLCIVIPDLITILGHVLALGFLIRGYIGIRAFVRESAPAGAVAVAPAVASPPGGEVAVATSEPAATPETE